jgi:Fe-S cluster biogenesis protein NfuA
MEPLSVREVSERIDTLLDELGNGAPPAVMERVEELVQCVMALYGAGLGRILGSVDDGTVRRLADDEVVGNLLVLHDLHPDDVDTRVQQALDRVRPYLGSHAGGVSLSGVDERGVVHLRLEGSGDGCPSSALTVKSTIEEAILVAAPDVVAVEAEEMAGTGPALLQIEPFRPHDPDPGGTVRR